MYIDIYVYIYITIYIYTYMQYKCEYRHYQEQVENSRNVILHERKLTNLSEVLRMLGCLQNPAPKGWLKASIFKK